MTEGEWLVCEQFGEVMSSAAINSPQWSFRKETLFCIACGRRMLAVLPDEQGLRLLTEFEGAALAPAEVVSADFSRPLANYVAEALRDPEADALLLLALSAVKTGYISQAAECCAKAIASKDAKGNVWPLAPAPEECRAQADIIRDVVGNPYRPVAFSSAWRTDTAVTLARQMYESRVFGAMPILADALQDAGCDNDDVLSHCREPGEHVRGCWVVDLVLGKE